MSENQVARIKVGSFAAGIIGIKELVEKMAEDYANKDNKEIREHMLKQLGKSNYIPSEAMGDRGLYCSGHEIEVTRDEFQQ